MKRLFVIVSLCLLASACGGSNDLLEQVEQSADSSEEEIAEVSNAGSGTLVFDGVEYPIDLVVCGSALSADVTAISNESGIRVLIEDTSNGPATQILDSDFRSWFDGDQFSADARNLVTFDGSSYTAPTNTWWNNDDERVVEGSFTVNCP